MVIDPAKRYTAEMVTSKGTMTIALDPIAAPATVNNFVFLARWHYYDGIVFHRIIPGFMLQGGDPEGSGRGGPGYRFNDELPAPGRYEIGSLAMANAGPNTNGSQFFIVSGPFGHLAAAQLLAVRQGGQWARRGQGHRGGGQPVRGALGAGGHRVGHHHRGRLSRGRRPRAAGCRIGPVGAVRPAGRRALPSARAPFR